MWNGHLFYFAFNEFCGYRFGGRTDRNTRSLRLITHTLFFPVHHNYQKIFFFLKNMCRKVPQKTGPINIHERISTDRPYVWQITNYLNRVISRKNKTYTLRPTNFPSTLKRNKLSVFNRSMQKYKRVCYTLFLPAYAGWNIS